jgi:hypothetical protein
VLDDPADGVVAAAVAVGLLELPQPESSSATASTASPNAGLSRSGTRPWFHTSGTNGAPRHRQGRARSYDRAIVDVARSDAGAQRQYPDRERLGGLAWTRRTGGRLTRSERRRLFAAIALGQWENTLGRAKLALGKLPAGAAAIDVKTFEPPDSQFAREAEQACAEQPAAIIGHSYRTWLFGRALAALDSCELDDELFYCGALVHDFGIAQPSPDRDFTLASVERMLACATGAGVPGERSDALADAICVHTTPGVTLEQDGSLGCYLQWGAMVDGAGLRLWDIARANVEEVIRRHPRPDFKRQLVELMRAEAAAVPGGRFGLLVRCGVPLAVRLAPFAE